MAAPTGTIWGPIANDYGKIGLYITEEVSEKEVTLTIEVWFASKYSVADNMGNHTYLSNLAEPGSATDDKGGTNIQTKVETGSGWSASNQVLLTGKSYSFTHDRGNADSIRYIYARLTDVGRVGETMYVDTTVIIPMLDHKDTVQLHDGEAYREAAVFIHDGNSYHQYAPYIHNGTEWERVQ